MVKIALIGGRRLELELEPKTSDSREADRLFDKVSMAIQKHWNEYGPAHQSTPPGQRKKKRDLRWLKVTSYTVLAEILCLELEEVFEHRIKKHRRYPRGQRGDPNPFQLGLMALFAEQPDILNSRDRERLGKQLWQAHRHYVPPTFLLGFLSQLEGKAPGPKLVGSDLLRDFKDWIIERRAIDAGGERGDYPMEIEQRVEEEEERRLRARGEDDDPDEEDELEEQSRLAGGEPDPWDDDDD